MNFIISSTQVQRSISFTWYLILLARCYNVHLYLSLNSDISVSSFPVFPTIPIRNSSVIGFYSSRKMCAAKPWWMWYSSTYYSIMFLQSAFKIVKIVKFILFPSRTSKITHNKMRFSTSITNRARCKTNGKIDQMLCPLSFAWNAFECAIENNAFMWAHDNPEWRDCVNIQELCCCAVSYYTYNCNEARWRIVLVGRKSEECT